MKNLKNNLKNLSTISIILAIAYFIVKFIIAHEYMVFLNGNIRDMIAITFNTIFNLFLFIGASVVFKALVIVIEDIENRHN